MLLNKTLDAKLKLQIYIGSLFHFNKVFLKKRYETVLVFIVVNFFVANLFLLSRNLNRSLVFALNFIIYFQNEKNKLKKKQLCWKFFLFLCLLLVCNFFC